MAKIAFVEDCLFQGTVVHKRFLPFPHSFNYQLSYLWIDLDQTKKLKLLKFNSFSLFSLYEKDFGSKSRKKSESLKNYLKFELAKHNIKDVNYIKLLCIPRIINYAFNPISVFVCFNKKKEQKAIIFEVSNTFGEKYAYLIDLDKVKGRIKKKKQFHVSPFFKVKGEYEFFLLLDKKKINLEISYFLNGKKYFLASFLGKKNKLTDRNLLFIFLTNIYQNILVTLGIHIQALKLWLKGAIYIKKPKAPKNFINGENNEKTCD